MKHLFIALPTLLLATFTVKAQDLHKTMKAHDGVAQCVAVSADGKMALTGGSDNRVYVWNIEEGKKLKGLGMRDKVSAVTFNNSASLIGTASGARITFYNNEFKPTKVLSEPGGTVNALAFNPLSNTVAAGSDGKNIRLLDADKGAPIANVTEHGKRVTAVAFSPDGKRFASASEDNTVRIFDAENGEAVSTIEAGQKGVYSLAWSYDGKYIASGGGDGSVFLWDPVAGTKVMELMELKSPVRAVSFSPDVQYLAVGGDDSKIIVWDLASQTVKRKLTDHAKGVTGVAFTDKGGWLVTTGKDGMLNIFDCRKLKIGKKATISSDNAPQLVVSSITVNDGNKNGILETGEKSTLDLTVTNRGKGEAFNVGGQLKLEVFIKGVEFDKDITIGNLAINTDQTISIPINITEDIETASGNFMVSIEDGNGNTAPPVQASFQTRGSSQYSYVMITEHSFTSGTGNATVGAPITLTLKVKNVSEGMANNIKVNFLFPDDVMAVDKLSEFVASLPPGETKDVSVQFYATEEYKLPRLVVGVSIEGAAFSNAGDLVMAIKMNEELPGTEVLAANAEEEHRILYRGGGDPLKGLNVAKSKEMVIGKYYALIIGVDQYKGHWTPLDNAVADAKAVESTLRTKYQFDQFKVLYNAEATRANIINELEKLVATVRPTDNVFIYYSGHGDFKQELNKGFWVPVDASTASTSGFISNSDLQTFLTGIKSKHTLLVSDACFSGDIFRGNTVSTPFEESEKYYKEVHNLVSRQAITSGGIEPVMDGGRDGHSVFAYYFLKTLRNNQNKYLDAGQLYTKLKIPVINNSEQTPRLQPIKKTGDEGGQFIFIRK